MPNTADNPSDKAYCDYMHFTDNEAYDIALANKADAEYEDREKVKAEFANPISGTEAEKTGII